MDFLSFPEYYAVFSTRFPPLMLHRIVIHLQQRLPQAGMHSSELTARTNQTLTCSLIDHIAQNFLAEVVASFSARHPDYSLLAGRVYTRYIHAKTTKQFSHWVAQHGARESYNCLPTVYRHGLTASAPLAQLEPHLVGVTSRHADVLDNAIIHSRDFRFT